MAKPTVFTYYCEVTQDMYNFKKGVYSYSSSRNRIFRVLELMHYSERVWVQGPKGGVRITKDRSAPTSVKYVTKDEKIMKQFMWVKLQAKPYHV